MDGGRVEFSATPSSFHDPSLPTAIRTGLRLPGRRLEPRKHSKETFEQAAEPTAKKKRNLHEENRHTEGNGNSSKKKRSPRRPAPGGAQPGRQRRRAATTAPGLADLIVNQIAEEQANIVTDPLLERAGRTIAATRRPMCAATCSRTTDRTAAIGGVGHGRTCKTKPGRSPTPTVGRAALLHQQHLQPRRRPLRRRRRAGPALHLANPVNASEIVGFDGMESTVSLIEGRGVRPERAADEDLRDLHLELRRRHRSHQGYAPGAPPCEAPWLSPCAASVFHSYQYGGTYKVDAHGHRRRRQRRLRRHTNSPSSARRQPGSGRGGSGAAPGRPGQRSASGSGTTGACGTPPIVAAPRSSRQVAAQRAAQGRSRSATRSTSRSPGTSRCCSPRSLARKLQHQRHRRHRAGPPARPPQLVIAKAILVTTKGGHSTVTIQLSKRTAAACATRTRSR